MWFNEETAGQLGLPILRRPRWEYEDWARIQLPLPEFYLKHPFCNSLESALIRTVSRNLANLSSLGSVRTKRYVWKNAQISIKEDPVKSLMYLDHPQGHAFIGTYRHEAFAYSFPCVGIADSRIEGEYVPVFLRDEDLVEGLDFDSSQAIFFRNRPLADISQPVMKKLESSLKPTSFD